MLLPTFAAGAARALVFNAVYLNETLFDECANLARRDRADRMLWHYTDLTGLRGIAAGQSLWLSSYNFMNDPSEGQLASRVLASCWCDAVDQFVGPVRLEREYLRDTSRALSGHGEHNPNIPETFLISFSTLGDSLSQWARYGADGSGVALGFQVDPALLALPAGGGWRHGPFLFEVLYDSLDLPADREPGSPNRAAAARFSEALTSLLTRFFPTVRDPTEADNALYDMVHTLAPLLKSGGYHEEEEWRIVATTTVDSPSLYHLRAGRFGLTPYLELPLGPGIRLTEVKLGPKLAKANRWSVEWLCRKYCIEAAVTQSALAYR